LKAREIMVLVPIVLVIVWIGVYPQPFLTRMGASTRAVVERLGTGVQFGALQMSVERCLEGDRQMIFIARLLNDRAALTCHDSGPLLPETER
jgi:hypothetical protein